MRDNDRWPAARLLVAALRIEFQPNEITPRRTPLETSRCRFPFVTLRSN